MKHKLHLIEKDLEALDEDLDLEEGGWLLIAIPQIENYLTNWARFQALHGA